MKRTPNIIKQRAKELRQEQTSAEAEVWAHLRGRHQGGYKFRRQHPIGQFIVDFCCIECRLVLEIDGSIHEQQRERDVERANILETQGYMVLRWSNTDVEKRLPNLLANLRSTLQILSNTFIPSSPESGP